MRRRHADFADVPQQAFADALRLDDQLCFPLYATANLITRAYRPYLRALGLTYPQYLVMLVLWEDGAANVGTIGDRLYLDSGTLSPLLKRLEFAGLITRRRSESDERQVLVEPTASGLALREAAARLPATLFCRLNMPIEKLLRIRSDLKDLLAILPPIITDDRTNASITEPEKETLR